MSIEEQIIELCDNINESYISYEDGVWYVHTGLNINHGFYDAMFEGENLDEVIKKAMEYEEEEA